MNINQLIPGLPSFLLFISLLYGLFGGIILIAATYDDTKPGEELMSDTLIVILGILWIINLIFLAIVGPALTWHHPSSFDLAIRRFFENGKTYRLRLY